MSHFRQTCVAPTASPANRLSTIFPLFIIMFQEALEEILIPRVEMNGGRKPRIVEYCIKKVLKPVVDFRESLFDRCFAIDGYLANRMLTMGYKFPSRFGRWCPVKVTQEPSQSALNQIRAPCPPNNKSYSKVCNYNSLFMAKLVVQGISSNTLAVL